MMEFVRTNINNEVRVKLTQHGLAAHRDHYKRLTASHAYVEPTVDRDGWTYFCLWDFMRIFGVYSSIGGDQLFQDNVVEFETLTITERFENAVDGID